MKENYIPGQGCKCHAHSEAECGCDVDWTPREVYELRATISDLETRHAATMLHTQSIVDEANELREQRDRLAEALRSIAALYESKEMTATVDQRIGDAYDMRCMARAALAAVKGGSYE